MRLASTILALLLAASAFAANAPTPSLGHWTVSAGSSGGGGGGAQLQQSNITYAGYFLVPLHGTNPPVSTDANDFVNGGAAITAGPGGAAPGTGTLYISNDPRNIARIGRITIPAVADWNGTTASVVDYLGSSINAQISLNSGNIPQNSEFTCTSTAGSSVLTVGSIIYYHVAVGYMIRGAGIGAAGPGLAAGTKIVSQASGGSGQAGTYNLSTPALSSASGNCFQNETEAVLGGMSLRPDGNLELNYFWYYPGGTNNSMTANAVVLSASDLSTILAYDQTINTGADGSQAGGMMGTVGSEWQTALGYSYMAGQGNIVANDARGTIGPSAFGTDLSYAYSGGASVPSTALANYPYSAGGGNEIAPGWTASGWPIQGTSPYVSGMDRGAGLAVVHGFSSLVTFGVHGVGPYCYGEPTSDPTLQRVPDTGTGDIRCYDLGTDLSGSSDKGVHAWPYEYWAWLWNESDLEAVKAGIKSPSAIYPYAAFQLPWPVGTGRTPGDAYTVSGGGYYDQASGYLYMLMSGGQTEYIAVWQISGTTSTPFTISTAHTLPACTHGVTCTITLTSSGGTAPITWKLLYTNPSYLTDLTLSTGGTLTLSSADTQTGTYDVMVEATDANGQDNMIGLSLTIN